MITVWVLWVLVMADGEWREWDHRYSRAEECEEVRQVVLHRREDKILAECRPKRVQKD